jgi:hypothetical protein
MINLYWAVESDQNSSRGAHAKFSYRKIFDSYSKNFSYGENNSDQNHLVLLGRGVTNTKQTLREVSEVRSEIEIFFDSYRIL